MRNDLHHNHPTTGPDAAVTAAHSTGGTTAMTVCRLDPYLPCCTASALQLVLRAPAAGNTLLLDC